MAEDVHAVFHYGAGGELTVEDSYSVETYVLYLVGHSDSFTDETVALAKAIADYGHYAQIYLTEVHNIEDGKYAEMQTYYTESYDIDAVRTAVDEYKLVLSGSSSVKSAAMRLSLDSETAMSIRLTVEDGAELTATATLNGKTFSAETQTDGSYIIKITGIKAAQLGSELIVTGTAGGEDFSVTVAPLAYVRSILNSSAYSSNLNAQNTVAAFYYYYAAIMAYRADQQ